MLSLHIYGIWLPFYVKQILLDLGIKLPRSTILCGICLWCQLKWTSFSKMVCKYWFGFGNKSEQISISALSWVYPNKATSFIFKNAGTDCLSLKWSPICPCVLIICRAVCFYPATEHLVGEHPRSGYLAWKPGEVILLNVHSLSVPENTSVQQGAVLSVGRKELAWQEIQQLVSLLSELIEEGSTGTFSLAVHFGALFLWPVCSFLAFGTDHLQVSWKAWCLYF